MARCRRDGTRRTRRNSFTDFSAVLLAALDRSAYRVAPLSPGSVVIPHLIIAEEVMEHEPRVARTLTDTAVGNDVIPGLQSAVFSVDLTQFRRRLERAVLIYRRFPRNALCAGDMAATEYAFLWVLRHVRHFTFELSG